MQPIAILAENVHAAADPILREAGFAIERHAGALEGDALRAALGRATVLGIRSKTSVREPALAAGRPAAIGCFCIGTDQVDLVPASRAGIPVFNSPFSNTRSVAE
ncbi:MAG: phosphoglycerate dehydrogenase, partial [Planctomycetota bacterium]